MTARRAQFAGGEYAVKHGKLDAEAEHGMHDIAGKHGGQNMAPTTNTTRERMALLHKALSRADPLAHSET